MADPRVHAGDRTRRRLALLACAVFLGAAAASPGPQGKNTSPIRPSLLTAPALPSAPSAPATKPTQQAQGEWKPSQLQQEMAIYASIAQALVGVLGLIGLLFTVLYAKRAWEAAEKSAAAADKTLKATREGERRQLRAYVHISEASFRSNVEGRWAEVKFKNFGLTPALDVWVERRASVRDFPLTEPLADLERDHGLFDLPPNGDGNTMIFPFAEWDDPSPCRFDTGGTALYVHGTIHYKDIFKKDRETHFRLYRRGTHDNGVSAAEQGNYVT